jgi:hypothetical protein
MLKIGSPVLPGAVGAAGAQRSCAISRNEGLPLLNAPLAKLIPEEKPQSLDNGDSALPRSSLSTNFGGETEGQASQGRRLLFAEARWRAWRPRVVNPNVCAGPEVDCAVSSNREPARGFTRRRLKEMDGAARRINMRQLVVEDSP